MMVRHNLLVMNVGRCLSAVSGREGKPLEKLASGYRINRAADDAAGLAISEKMRCQIRGITRASANAQEGISLLQTAEGALEEVHDMLQRANELAIQSANGINSEIDRKSIQKEFEQIKLEIDRVASGTNFNRINLFDGSLGRKSSAKTAMPCVIVPNIIVYDVSIRDVVTTQTTYDSPLPGNDELKTALKEQIVPQAVSALVNTFSNTFGYLKGSNIGIGLGIYDNANSSTLAYIGLQTITQKDPYTNALISVELNFNLTVNMGFLTQDSSRPDGLSVASRTALEGTITHEMMHAMMNEAMTAGMIEKDASGNYAKGFPSWFVEGTAQAACGGAGWVKSRGGLNINGDSTDGEIKAALSGTHRLGTGTSASKYATGYLATMYLGSLAGGGNDATSVATGLDKILSDIRDGKSMDQAIADYTSYTSTSDFEDKFANDSAAFVKSLMTAAGNNGSGALVTKSYTDIDLLPDENKSQDIFILNTNVYSITNQYPTDYVVLSGGTRSGTGVSYNGTASGTGGGGIGGVTTPSGGSTPGDTTGGIGGKLEGGLTLQIGANSNQTMAVYIEAMNTASLGIDAVDMSTGKGAEDAIPHIHEAINKVSMQRADLGAWQNRLEHTIRNLDNTIENTQSAESLIRDTDMAAEMSGMIKQRILRQVGQAMLAQANQTQHNVLNLLS